MLVTHEELTAHGACETWVNRFNAAYPNGIDTDSDNVWIDLIEKGFGAVLYWPARYFKEEIFHPTLRDGTLTEIPEGPYGRILYLDRAVITHFRFVGITADLFDMQAAWVIEDVVLQNCEFGNLRIPSGVPGFTFVNCTTRTLYDLGYLDLQNRGIPIPDGLTVTTNYAWSD